MPGWQHCPPPFCVFSERGDDDDDTSFGFQGATEWGKKFTLSEEEEEEEEAASAQQNTLSQKKLPLLSKQHSRNESRNWGIWRKKGRGGEKGDICQKLSLSVEFCHLFFLCFWRSTLRGKVGEIYFFLLSPSMRGN